MKDEKPVSNLQRLAKRIPVLFTVILAARLPTYGQTILTDPVGDASGNHDAIAISGGFARSNLYLTATFQPGSLDRNRLAFIFGFDTDQNAATAIGHHGLFPIGAESTCSYNASADPNHVEIWNGVSNQAATLPIHFESNSLSITIPLARIGDTDGIMNFGFICGVPTSTSSFNFYDAVPDSVWGGPLVGPTSLIPELNIARLGTNTELRWPVQASNYVLQATSELAVSNMWVLVTNEVGTVGSENVVVDSSPPQKRFYRLRK